jgi:NAD-dependent SIR2 family protein deacetylase
LLRPHVVWFGECLEVETMECAHNALEDCDLLLVIGTSAVVQVLQFVLN